MAKEPLAELAIAAGRHLAQALSNTGLRIEAAFWIWDEARGWRLVLATPLVHELGRLVAYDHLRASTGGLALESEEHRVKDLIDLVSPSESVITIFDLARASGTLPENRLIEDEFVGGVWIEGAFVYFFEPRTFMSSEDVDAA
jgi:hypothetical protein